jgi:hypothetical protein
MARLDVALLVALLQRRKLQRSSTDASEVSATLKAIKEMTSSGRRSQRPPEAILFGESMVVGLCDKMDGKWKRRESVDGVRSASGCVRVYRGRGCCVL